jgi:hypothetical protein
VRIILKIQLHKNATGLNKTITYDAKTKTIHTQIEDLYWTSKNFKTLFKHLNLEPPECLDEKYKVMTNTLNIASSSIDWPNLLGKEVVKNKLDNLFSSLNTIEDMSNEYYESILPKRLSLFTRLQSFYLDGALQDRLFYNHHKTVTGRTVVSSGINLVTMRKQDRKLLESKYDNGAIIEIDLKSIEPHLYLSLIKNINTSDAYEFIAMNVLNYKKDNFKRDKVKLAFISTLYGAGETKLKNLTGLPVSDIRKIKKFLEIEKFKKKIEAEFHEKGYFENAYGRKIFSINAPINYYLQSTAVDYACLAFENFMSKFENKKIDLIGVIVDAIILDVHPSCINQIIKVKSVNEPIININTNISIERHS